MPYAVGGNSRIRTNTSAENAYNSLEVQNKKISQGQLRLSTGKKINNAADDVAGYITSRALSSRNGALKAALNAVGDAQNVSNIIMDALDNISNLISQIKDDAATASSGALGTDERVALAKASYSLAEQIQTVCDATVYSGQQLLSGSYCVDFVMGLDASNGLLLLGVDLTSTNPNFNTGVNFDTNALHEDVSSFGGVTGLNLRDLDSVSANDLGIFSKDNIKTTLQSLAAAISNFSKVNSYVGGVVNRLGSQEDLLKGQVTNYNSAISRFEDADIAQEQLNLVKAQFLQQSSLISLTQANSNPQAFLQLLKG